MRWWMVLGWWISCLCGACSSGCSDDDTSGGGSGGTAAAGGTTAHGGSGGTGTGTGGGAGAAGGGVVSAGCPTGIGSDPDVGQALPQAEVDTTWIAPTGSTITVPSGGDLQGALDSASPGDVIELEAGATFTGPFTLPGKSGSDWITIRTSTPDAQLPAPGTRIDPSHAPLLPKIVVPDNVGSAIGTAAGAHHYRLVGLEVSPEPGAFAYNVIDLGSGTQSPADLPHHIIIDRCYVHGDPTVGARRGVGLNSGEAAIIDSWFADFMEVGADTQAIAGWGGPGPYKIVNNHLEGAAENVMFGGADPAMADTVPSDITICANHFFKPTAWRSTSWSVKNLFELKNARRVLVAGNVFENNWADAQVGFAIVLTPRNQDGTAPWSTIEDVTFVYNVVRHSGSGLTALGEDSNHSSQQQQRLVVQHNLFEDIDRAAWGGDGRVFQVVTPNLPVVGLKIDHNTVTEVGNAFLVAGDTVAVAQGFWFTNNVVPRGDYGAFGSGQGEGTQALDHYFPGHVFTHNAIVGASAASYPAGNFFPATMADVGFVDFAGGDYSLAGSSPYADAATDGGDLGADMAALLAATGGVAP